MSPWLVPAVVLGGLVGAPVRFLADRFVSERLGGHFPWGTFLVNASGSLLLGLLTGLGLRHHLSPSLLALAGTGFCGAYTTFSSWSFETVRLLEEGRLVRALLNCGGSLLLGLGLAGGVLAAVLAW